MVIRKLENATNPFLFVERKENNGKSDHYFNEFLCLFHFKLATFLFENDSFELYWKNSLNLMNYVKVFELLFYFLRLLQKKKINIFQFE